jgi:DnaJ-domain-containing protein 1
MDEGLTRLHQMQNRILSVIVEEVQRWLDDLLRDAFNPEDFLRFVAGTGFDLSQMSGLVGQPGGLDPYRVLGLEKTATDQAVKKRYRQFLMKFHPDTAGMAGTDCLLQIIREAYQQIAIERGWH